MKTIIFYALLCLSPTDCNEFEPYSWQVTAVHEEQEAFKECSILANAYEKLQAVKEVDCYLEGE